MLDITKMNGEIYLKRQNKKIITIVAYTISGIPTKASQNDFGSYIIRQKN